MFEYLLDGYDNRYTIVTDLHGNKEDFNEYYNNIWNKEDKNHHLIITGDFIHGDFDVFITEQLMKDRMLPNLHVTAGNHEASQYKKGYIYKNNRELTKLYIKSHKLFEDKLKYSYKQHLAYFMLLQPYIILNGKIFVNHGGIPVMNEYSRKSIVWEGLKNLETELLWNRPWEDYTVEDVDIFLRLMRLDYAVGGHTRVNGYEQIGRQWILSSSDSLGKRCYMDITKLDDNCCSAVINRDYIKYLD